MASTVSHNTTSTNNTNNNNKSTQKSIYVEYEVPDTRKRFTVSFLKDDKSHETLCVVIPNKFTWSGFIHLLLTKFKLDSNLKNKIRVKTNDGRRIVDLTNTYNNQLIQFSLSELYEDEQQDIEIDANGLQSLRSSFNNSTTDINTVQKLTFINENQNKFIKDAIKLISIYKDSVVVGESFPYRVKVLLPFGNASLYFIDQPNYEDNNNNVNDNYQFKTIIHCKDQVIYKQIQSTITMATANDTIVTLTAKIVALVPGNKKKDYIGVVGEPTRSLFPRDYKIHYNISPNDYVSEHMGFTNAMTKKYDIPFSLARDFLFQCKWSIKKTRSFEKKNFDDNYPTHTKRDVSKYNFNSLNLNLEDGDDIFDCPICYCDCPIEETIELLCGHRFCNDCLGSYFSNSIQDGNGAAVSIPCPSPSCLNKYIDEVTVETFLTPTFITRLQENYVNDLMFFTKSKKCTCGYIFKPPYDTSTYIPFYECQCGSNICLDCGAQEIHWPLACKDARNDDDLQSYDWIAKNTTICPSCQFPVEKWTGCNHMTCSRCRHEFCYLCGNDYRGHYTCPSSRNVNYKYQKFFKALRGREMNPEVIQAYIEQDSKPALSLALKSIHNNMIFLSMRRKNATKNFILSFEALFMTLSEFAFPSIKGSGNATPESINFLQRCTRKFMRETRKPPSFYKVFIDQGPIIRSVSVNICLNGSSVVISKEFVKTQFYEFKQDIISALKKKKIDGGYNAETIRLFNQYGGQIKSSLEIFDKENIYITKDSDEKFIVPLDDPDMEDEDIEQDNQLVTISFGEMSRTFNEVKQKKHAKLDSHIKKLEKTQKDQAAITQQINLLRLLVVEEEKVNDVEQDTTTATPATDTTDTTESSEDENDNIQLSQFIKEFVKINKSDSENSSSGSESDKETSSTSITNKEEENLKMVERVFEHFNFLGMLDYDFVYQVVCVSADFNSAIQTIAAELYLNDDDPEDDNDYYDDDEDKISNSVKKTGKRFHY